MYNVRMIIGGGTEGRKHLRQMPGKSDVSLCGKYRFCFDEQLEDPDFVVVRNKYIKKSETLHVAPENTVLLISEPQSVVAFPKSYLRQFGLIHSCQANIQLPNVVYGPAVLPWFIGFTRRDGTETFTYDYDGLSTASIPEKRKLISVITSNKASTPGHLARIEFVKKLKDHYGDLLDVFGRGFNDFDDKWDVLAPYKYHIAIENSSSRYYWTEKLSDCYLTTTFPIYYGCTNVEDYFPDRGLQTIDIHDVRKSIATIDKVIAEGLYERNHDALSTCKHLVLNDYNMFEIITRCLDRLNPNATKRRVTLNPPVSLLDFESAYRSIIQRNWYRVKSFFRKQPTFK